MIRKDLVFTKKQRFVITPTCPCGKSNRDGKFIPYEGFNDKGYCHSCDKAFYPEEYSEKNIYKYNTPNIPFKFIDRKIMLKSMSHHDQNNLYQYIQRITNKADQLFQHFKVGTAKNGCTVFWLVDINKNIRQPKLIKYNLDGHRIGDPYVRKGYTRHSGFSPCLFGEEHIKPGDIIALVESEKTALLGHNWLPKYRWIAFGGASGLSKEKADVLLNNRVIIIPDADVAGRDGARKTLEKLSENKNGVSIVDLFPELNNGYDIADYVVDMQNAKCNNTKGLHFASTGKIANAKEQKLEFLIKKNPLVKTLIDRLKLEPSI